MLELTQTDPEWPPLAPEKVARYRQFRLRQVRDFGLGLSVLGLIGVAWYWAMAAAHLLIGALGPMTFLFGVAGIALTSVWVLVRRMPWDATLLDIPNDPGAMVATIKVEVDGVVRGADRGVLWIEDQCLFFHGERTWFRIARQDLRGFGTEFPSTARHGELVENAGMAVLNLVTHGPKVRIGIVTTPLTEPVVLESRGQLLRMFRHDATHSKLETKLPPLSFDPYYRDTLAVLALGATTTFVATYAVAVAIKLAHFFSTPSSPQALWLLSALGLFMVIPFIACQIGRRARGASARLQAQLIRRQAKGREATDR